MQNEQNSSLTEFVRRHQVGLAVAVVGGVVIYIILDVIAQLQPPHYSALHQPESDLGVGPYSFFMNANFVVRALTAIAVGVLVSSRASGRRGRVGVVLIAIWGVCSGLLAVFRTDVATGPFRSITPTVHGDVHLVLAFAGFSAAGIGICLVGSRAFLRLQHARPLIVAPSIMLAVFVVAAASTDLFGLFERLFIATVLIWTAAVGTDRLRVSVRQSNSPRRRPSADLAERVRR